jgi:1,3-beta-glucanosyltransferase GAS3
MYMAIDVNAPGFPNSLPRDKPYEGYFDGYLTRIFGIVEGFKDYPNTLLFFSSNELINNVATGELGPRYIRAVTRDLKNYIKKHSDRYIPVGYSAADFRDTLYDSWRYFTCKIEGEEDNESQADFFALNSYSWCGKSSFKQSTYEELVTNMKSSPVPIFFSEYGCNEVTPRIFQEIGTVYGSEMMGVFSGGLVYEYSMEPNNYGMVTLKSDGSAEVLQDFNTLTEQFKKLDMSKVQGQAVPDDTPEAPLCEAKLITTEGFDKNFTLPSMPFDKSSEILENGVQPAPVGALKDVANLKVKYIVKDSKGNVIQNLEVKQRDTPNVPGFNTALDTSSDVASESDVKGGNSSDKKDAGSNLKPFSMAAMLLPVVAILVW